MQGSSYNSLFPKSIWIHLCMLVKLVSIIIVHTFQFVRQSNKYLSSGSDCTLWMTSNSMLLYCQRGTMTLVALCFWYTLFLLFVGGGKSCNSLRKDCLIYMIPLLNLEIPELEHFHRIYLPSISRYKCYPHPHLRQVAKTACLQPLDSLLACN